MFIHVQKVSKALRKNYLIILDWWSGQPKTWTYFNKILWFLLPRLKNHPKNSAAVPDLPLQPVSKWTPICPPSAPQHVAASPATLVSAEDAACLSCSWCFNYSKSTYLLLISYSNGDELLVQLGVSHWHVSLPKGCKKFKLGPVPVLVAIPSLLGGPKSVPTAAVSSSDRSGYMMNHIDIDTSWNHIKSQQNTHFFAYIHPCMLWNVQPPNLKWCIPLGSSVAARVQQGGCNLWLQRCPSCIRIDSTCTVASDTDTI